MSLISVLLLTVFAFLAGNVRETEAGCCCCHCCKCCSCCTPCCNPPLLIKLPRTCPCCCKCCCPCCCCGGGGRKRRDVRLLWKRTVPFPQLQLPASFGGGGCSGGGGAQKCACGGGAALKAAKKREIVNLKDFLVPSLKKSD